MKDNKDYWKGQVDMARCILEFVDWETEHISKEEVKYRIEALMNTNLDLIKKAECED